MKSLLCIPLVFLSFSSFAETTLDEAPAVVHARSILPSMAEQVTRDLDYIANNRVVLVKPHKQSALLCDGQMDTLKISDCFTVAEPVINEPMLIAEN